MSHKLQNVSTAHIYKQKNAIIPVANGALNTFVQTNNKANKTKTVEMQQC